MTIKQFTKISLIAIFVCVFAYLIVRDIYSRLAQPSQVAQVATSGGSLPISGTFVIPDITYSSESQYREFFQELQDSGINLVIFTLTSNLTKNCSNNSYNEEIDIRLNAGNPPFLPIAIKLAKEMGMTIYFDSGYSTYSTCFQFQNGTMGNENTDKGRLIAYSLRALSQLKSFISKNGFSWDDPQFAGIYLSPEGDTRQLADNNSSQMIFFKEFSRAIKSQEPNKKILLSPYQYEDATYEVSKNAFYNILQNTDVDILAPQDSMGTGVTSSLNRNSDHFRGLGDALGTYKRNGGKLPKEVWANIETFGTPGGDNFVSYQPADFSRVKDQISSAAPYVSRMITWIYQHTMLSNPRSDNIAAINIYAPGYTPANAVLRKKLHSEYLTYYRGGNLYYYHKDSKSCRKTSNTYTDINLCTKNLAIFLPNQTTEKCYESAESCSLQNMKIGFDKAQLMYYYHLQSKSCRKTNNTYTDLNLCATNLGVYLPNKTSGKCYLDFNTCKIGK